MNPLQYTSEEMFSSTELIRKSKSIFDKLHKKDIEKAIILRDGKPAFMLLDFAVYEDMMSEYIALKDMAEEKEKKPVQKKAVEKSDEVLEEENAQIKNEKDLDEKDLEEALAEIENLNLDNIQDSSLIDGKEPLKDFWE